MSDNTVTIDISSSDLSYDISVGGGTLGGAGTWAKDVLGQGCRRIAIVSNRKVFGLYGKTVVESLNLAGYVTFVFLMGDGERYKNLRSLEQALGFIGDSRLTRSDAVVALGGGVVGDLAGIAASVYMRGIALLQIPTTLLSMIDSSVGGKTGVNTAFGKNTVGTFSQPRGVLIDVRTLATLPKRELTAGFCEAIKQGALSGRELFDQTERLLTEYPVLTMFRKNVYEDLESSLSRLVSEQVAFKASVVAGDQFESVGRKDGRSRKILNFGHTLAHALEKVTDYKYLKHGEAVGYGILYAVELSKKLALIDEHVVNLFNGVVRRAGILPKLDKIDPKEVFEAFRFDKKLVGDSVQMILLKGIGKPVIVSGSEIPKSTHLQVLKYLLKK
ncbi:MAG: 3-dehydroquinate synthase [Pyrinomonadaceae bacterium]|nr:3-dehydroquinate synthase [Pyrinomonadaceae bacterium]MBP6212749.1 3-dehydroquinate synthase [Pyrinomonadaceae bacterium]